MTRKQATEQAAGEGQGRRCAGRLSAGPVDRTEPAPAEVLRRMLAPAAAPAPAAVAERCGAVALVKVTREDRSGREWLCPPCADRRAAGTRQGQRTCVECGLPASVKGTARRFLSPSTGALTDAAVAATGGGRKRATRGDSDAAVAARAALSPAARAALADAAVARLSRRGVSSVSGGGTEPGTDYRGMPVGIGTAVTAHGAWLCTRCHDAAEAAAISARDDRAADYLAALDPAEAARLRLAVEAWRAEEGTDAEPGLVRRRFLAEAERAVAAEVWKRAEAAADALAVAAETGSPADAADAAAAVARSPFHAWRNLDGDRQDRAADAFAVAAEAACRRRYPAPPAGTLAADRLEWRDASGPVRGPSGVYRTHRESGWLSLADLARRAAGAAALFGAAPANVLAVDPDTLRQVAALQRASRSSAGDVRAADPAERCDAPVRVLPRVAGGAWLPLAVEAAGMRADALAVLSPEDRATLADALAVAAPFCTTEQNGKVIKVRERFDARKRQGRQVRDAAARYADAVAALDADASLRPARRYDAAAVRSPLRSAGGPEPVPAPAPASKRERAAVARLAAAVAAAAAPVPAPAPLPRRTRAAEAFLSSVALRAVEQDRERLADAGGWHESRRSYAVAAR